MNKILKRVKVVILVCIIAVCTGCTNEFDAAGYVQAILDASYKGEYEKYLELTEDTHENAENNYETILNVKAEMFRKAMKVEDNDVYKMEFYNIVKELFSKAEYTVGEAVKEDNQYIVEVTIKPIDILPVVIDKCESFIEEFNARNQAGEFVEYSEEQYYKEYTDGIVDIFRSEVANITYGEEITIKLNVHKAEDNSNLYVLDDASYTEIDSAIFLYQ